MRKLVFITSHPMSVMAFMLPHLKVLHPYVDLDVWANTQEVDLLQKRGLDIPVKYAPVCRPLRPWVDAKALWWLYRHLLISRPDAVHTLTPKAGLLGMIAAWLARVPVRVHTFTGQVWLTRKGLMRWMLKTADKCIAAFATDVLIDSPSQRNFLLENSVVRADKSTVLGAGSICGVDTQRFFPSPEVRHDLRAEMGTADDALVCLYLGRLNYDKGVVDLAAAFAKVAILHPCSELWIVGPDEEDVFMQMQSILSGLDGRVRRVGYTQYPERFMQAADIFCLPSYREGFGSSVIEAAACGVPALVSRIYGLTDAVQEGKTGWMHEAGNVQDLALKLDEVLRQSGKLKIMGLAAKEYAAQFFEQGLVTDALLKFYAQKLGE